MKFRRSAIVRVDREALWRLFMDVPRSATFLPGVESIEQVGRRTYRGTLLLRLGPIALHLQGRIVQAGEDHDAWRASWRAEAEDRRIAGAVRGEATMELVERNAGETDVRWETEISIFGRLGDLGRPIVRAQVDRLMGVFFRNIRHGFAEPGTPERRAATRAKR